MSLKSYLILMTAGALISWLGWVLVINFIDPITAGPIGFTFFYLSLFLALTSTISIIGLFIRMKISKSALSRIEEGELIKKEVEIGLRQGILFSILIVGVLFLQSQKLLTWWNIILFILALTILEFFFISFRYKR